MKQSMQILRRTIGFGLVIGIGAALAANWKTLSQAATSSPAAGSKVAVVSPAAGSNSTTVRNVKFAKVQPAPAPEPLRLTGSLCLDPNRLVHVHSRFSGEAVAIGEVVEGDQTRPLQYGDRVTKGQVLAVVWSKDIGEKKCELVDALSRLNISEALLQRIEGLRKGVVAAHVLTEARRDVEADLIAVARAERTLRSWRVTDEEIEVVRREHKNLRGRTGTDDAMEQEWAETEIQAAIDGVIVEKNFNVGDMVDPQDDIFKIADLTRLQVRANVYEEDLGAIRAMQPAERRWSIALKSDPSSEPVAGTFELIGSMIDPSQRTGVVMGWIDNRDSKLLVGQFVTATARLPHDPGIVAIPEAALLKADDSAATYYVELKADRQEPTRQNVVVVRRCAGTVYVKSTSGAAALQAGDDVAIGGSRHWSGELAHLRTGNSPRS